MKTETLTEQVINRIYSRGRGYVFTTADFSDIAKSHDPAFSKIINELAPPNPNSIAQAIARNHGWTILPDGETALNMLGLSTQVPSSWEYLIDGPYRSYE